MYKPFVFSLSVFFMIASNLTHADLPPEKLKQIQAAAKRAEQFRQQNSPPQTSMVVDMEKLKRGEFSKEQSNSISSTQSGVFTNQWIQDDQSKRQGQVSGVVIVTLAEGSDANAIALEYQLEIVYANQQLAVFKVQPSMDVLKTTQRLSALPAVTQAEMEIVSFNITPK